MVGLAFSVAALGQFEICDTMQGFSIWISKLRPPSPFNYEVMSLI